MNVGYVRVSSKQQNTNRQTDMMEELGVEKMYVEKMSGKNMERPQLQEMMNFLREGDILIVESISRLARNTKDLLELTEKLDAKGVKFVSKKENIDTTTPAGKFILTIFGALAELERSYIRDRQTASPQLTVEVSTWAGLCWISLIIGMLCTRNGKDRR